MATVETNDNEFEVYADVDFADAYLDGDFLRAPLWTALGDTDGIKERALVSATRLLQRQTWISGSAPDIDNPPEAVAQATAMLACDIAQKPAMGDSAATGSNVKAVGAGSARVEFFAPVTSMVLPPAVLGLLVGLIGSPPLSAGDTDNVAYGSSSCQQSRFDRTDYRLQGESSPIVDRDELYW